MRVINKSLDFGNTILAILGATFEKRLKIKNFFFKKFFFLFFFKGFTLRGSFHLVTI